MNTPVESGRPSLDIRKYPNRRYYDASHSRHLTLEEIRSLIREGYDIKVTDSKSGADITAQVLTQIILELETPKLDTFPIPLLLRLIRVNDQLVKDFMDKYFSQAFQSWIDYQKQMEDRLRQMQNAGVYGPFSAWTQAMMSPFPPPNTSESNSPTPNAKPTGTEPPSTEDLRKVIKDLQRQVAGLHPERQARKGKSRRTKR